MSGGKRTRDEDAFEQQLRQFAEEVGAESAAEGGESGPVGAPEEAARKKRRGGKRSGQYHAMSHNTREAALAARGAQVAREEGADRTQTSLARQTAATGRTVRRAHTASRQKR